MASSSLPEHWLRGSIPGLSPYLQPVAHALLQAKDEVTQLMTSFPTSLLWENPAGVASPGFHLRHLTGVLDRLFTYAMGKGLTPEQLSYLQRESDAGENDVTADELVVAFQRQIDQSIQFLKNLDEQTITEPRAVGRSQLPSTVLGLLFHAAEHTMRHTGQLLVTVNVLLQKEKG